MASDRQEAKASITSQENNDPDLESALASGHALQLKLSQEKNRHIEAKIDKDLGFFGKVIGGKELAPIVIAAFVVVLGYLSAIACGVMSAKQTAQADFWAKQAERAIGVGSAALTYIFGKSGKS